MYYCYYYSYVYELMFGYFLSDQAYDDHLVNNKMSKISHEL